QSRANPTRTRGPRRGRTGRRALPAGRRGAARCNDTPCLRRRRALDERLRRSGPRRLAATGRDRARARPKRGAWVAEDRTVVVDEMTRSGFRLVAEPVVLPYQYLLIFAVA